VRLSPFGPNPPAFFRAVTLLGPQRISNPAEQGDLLVIGKVQNQPHTYACLPDNSYIPVLVDFLTAAHQPLAMRTVSDDPEGTPLVLVMARPYNLGDLTQRLAEYAIMHHMAVPHLSMLAVNLWFNAGLIDTATATADLARIYRYHFFPAKKIAERLAEVSPLESQQLRHLATRVVEDVVSVMVRSYRQEA